MPIQSERVVTAPAQSHRQRLNPCLPPLMLLLTVVLLSGCNSFSLKESGAQMYRVNHITGSVSLIKDLRMMPVESYAALEKQSATKTSKENFALSNLGPNVNLEFQRKWREGAMYYIATLSRFEGKVKESRESSVWSAATINVDFEDNDAFLIYTLPLRVNAMTRIVNGSGEATALTIKGSIPLSADTYKSINGASVGWSGFPN